MGYEVDFHTEEDLHVEGVELLKQYDVVLTGHHPEYISEEMMDYYHDYQMQGGRCNDHLASGSHDSNPSFLQKYIPDDDQSIQRHTV